MQKFSDVIRSYLLHLWIYIREMSKWLLVSVLIGILCGLLGSAFHIGVEKATIARESHPWILYLLPAAGLLVTAIYTLFRVNGQNTNDIISEVQKGQGLSLRLLPAIFLSTVITHLAGGSSGREGAALQMGGTIGFSIGRLLHLDDRDLRTGTMIGMAAFFSALFGTPLGATLFAMGVISVGILYHAAFIPCFIASMSAYGISLLFGITPTHFVVAAPEISLVLLLKVSVLAILCSFLSVFFCVSLHQAHKCFSKLVPSPWLRAFLGGVLLLALTLLIGSTDYNGAGMSIIRTSIEEGRTVPWAFLLKLVFTVITLSAGFTGGEVVPSFFIGATFGCIIGPVLGLPAGFSAALGLISVFCGCVNCPIASVVLAVELFGVDGLACYALACGLSFVFSGYSGLYSSQRILYDKLKARYIDVHTNAHHEGREIN